MNISMNKRGVVDNRYQQLDKYKRVLTVCSGGCLRSPTAAFVLGQEPYNYNTRSCGIETNFAIVPMDDTLVLWADEIVFMNQWMLHEAKSKYDLEDKKLVVLNIPDRFPYRDPKLVELIKANYNEN